LPNGQGFQKENVSGPKVKAVRRTFTRSVYEPVGQSKPMHSRRLNLRDVVRAETRRAACVARDVRKMGCG
jgi:hypothetical protein